MSDGALDISRRRCPICGELTAAELCPVDRVSTLLVESSSLGVASLSVGSVLGGRYAIERLIGKGGFGSVFQARHTGTGQGVAIKTLGAGLEQDDVALRRFFQEARVTAGLRHPNTIRVFDFGQESNGMLYLAMELLTGVTLKLELKARQRQGRVFTEGEALEIGEAVCRSLAEAHAAGLVHRDLKPDNVFLHNIGGDDIVVKVLDFGIVKLANSSLTMGSDSGVPGTPAYMSPEQVAKKEIDPRSDLYSLGVLLYALVTGDVPFRGQDALQTLYMHVHEPLPSVREHAKTPLSDRFVEVIERTLSKDPAARPQDAKELRALLAECGPRAPLKITAQLAPTPAEAAAVTASQRSTPLRQPALFDAMSPRDNDTHPNPSGPVQGALPPRDPTVADATQSRHRAIAAGFVFAAAVIGGVMLGLTWLHDDAPASAIVEASPAPRRAEPQPAPPEPTAPAASASTSPSPTAGAPPPPTPSASPASKPAPKKKPAKGTETKDEVLDEKI